MSIDLKISERGENLKTTTEHLASCLFKVSSVARSIHVTWKLD